MVLQLVYCYSEQLSLEIKGFTYLLTYKLIKMECDLLSSHISNRVNVRCTRPINLTLAVFKPSDFVLMDQ